MCHPNAQRHRATAFLFCLTQPNRGLSGSARTPPACAALCPNTRVPGISGRGSQPVLALPCCYSFPVTVT